MVKTQSMIRSVVDQNHGQFFLIAMEPNASQNNIRPCFRIKLSHFLTQIKNHVFHNSSKYYLTQIQYVKVKMGSN